MALLRYAQAEAKNIAAARKDSIRQSAMMAAIANRKAEAALDALTAADIGLGDVDNTSDANKPVSTATQTALDAKATLVAAPALASSSGTAGQIAYDSSYFYVCISSNTWKRVAISTW